LIAKKLPKNIAVAADSAEPKSIADLHRFGVKVSAVKKGADSILFGINLLKRYKLHITARSVNLLKEQKLYKYKTDNIGQPTNTPIDHYNHAWDAVRYYALTFLGTGERKAISFSK
jgi:phage terminase large subunit